MKRFGLCGLVALAFVSVFGAMAQADSIGFSLSDSSPATPPDQLNVTVLDGDTQVPIEGAGVSVTDSLGFGPISQRMPADARGLATFYDPSPVPKTVTVTKAGYATFSIVGVQSTNLVVELQPIVDAPKTVVASGTITDWDGVSTDDSSVVHGGAVFRTVSAADLLRFQLSNFVSPLQDTLDLGGIAGKHKIPSNIVLPDQSVSYLFFSIELNHPTYRLPIPVNQSLGLTGVEVEADVSDVVSGAQSMNIDLLNKLRFKRVGITSDFSSAQDVSRDVNASAALSDSHHVSISQQPSFDADIIAASLTDVNGDKSALVPTDVKVIYNHNDGDDPQPVTLAAPQAPAALGASAQLAVATVAVGTQGQLSGVLSEPAGSSIQAGDFLDTAALPQNQSALPATVTVQAPANGIGAAIFETDQPVWYVYTLPIAGSVQVPTAKVAAAEPVKSYSVNRIEFSKFNPNAVDGSKIMSLLQRFARSSAKLSAH